MVGTPVDSVQEQKSIFEVIQCYYQLTKPRIIPLLLITTASSMWIASHGEVNAFSLMMTMLGGTLASASAQVLNCVYDQDIDYTMQRTRSRPLPAGIITPQKALIFALILAILSFTLLTTFVNLLSAFLALSGLVFYVLVYTHFLKRHTVQNIVIGGAAGAIPPLVGWSAVTGELSWTAWVLFSIVFLWTPPHFWALALMIKEDYAQVNVPMLPVIKGEKATVTQIWIYSLLVIPFSLLLVYPLNSSGWLYATIALILGWVFLLKAWQLKQNPDNRDTARSMFKFSILYLMLLSTGMVIDSLPVTQHFINHLGEQFAMIISLIPILN